MSRHPLYVTWGNMVARCHNPRNKRYADYGGRGIFVTALWKGSSSEFVEWGLKNGWLPGLQIDRIDNDGPYAPHNCRFVTPRVNMASRRSTKYVTAFGERKRFGEWLHDSRCAGVSASCLAARLRRGMKPESAISKPPVDRSPKFAACAVCGKRFKKTISSSRACSMSCGVALGHRSRKTMT